MNIEQASFANYLLFTKIAKNSKLNLSSMSDSSLLCPSFQRLWRQAKSKSIQIKFFGTLTAVFFIFQRCQLVLLVVDYADTVSLTTLTPSDFCEYFYANKRVRKKLLSPANKGHRKSFFNTKKCWKTRGTVPCVVICTDIKGRGLQSNVTLCLKWTVSLYVHLRFQCQKTRHDSVNLHQMCHCV